MRKIYLSDTDKKLAGVCGGIAEAYDLDPTVVRLVFILIALLTQGFPALVAYIIAALVIPKRKHVVHEHHHEAHHHEHHS